MKKKILSILLCISVICFCFGFTACGALDNANNEANNNIEQDGNEENNGNNSTEQGGTVQNPDSCYLEFELLDNGSYQVKKFIGNVTEVVIPSTYNGRPVTSIESAAFSGCIALTNITIPDSVTSIGAYAFLGCIKLMQIENGVVYVDKWVIDCEKFITDAILRADTRGIAGSAFSNCNSLTSITIPDGVISIGAGAFRDCGSLTDITIPDSVTSIGNYAFGYCSSLKYNEYDNGLYLGSDSNPYLWLMEAKSKDITTCQINNKTKFICGYAFMGCSSLASITIPNSVTSIGEHAFYICTSLKAVFIEDIAKWCEITFGSDLSNPMSYAFKLYVNEKLITDLVIPDSVTSIGNYAFKNCKALTSITIPDSVISIGNSAFADCSSLTIITISDSVTSIGNYAFNRCKALTSIIIPDSVTSIGEYAFSECSSLTSITIGNDVTSICNYAFSECGSLTSITIGNGVTSIGNCAFSGCRSLTSVTIPDSVTSIGEYAFGYCSSLKYNEYDNALYLGNDSNPYLWLIEAKSKDITSIQINSKTKFIYRFAFSDCSLLTSVMFENTNNWYYYGSDNELFDVSNDELVAYILKNYYFELYRKN